MRSRYTAHVLLAVDYLWATWSPEQRLRSNKDDIRAWAESCDWLGLQILSTQQGGAEDESGKVEFIALFRQQGQLQQHQVPSIKGKQQAFNRLGLPQGQGVLGAVTGGFGGILRLFSVFCAAIFAGLG